MRILLASSNELTQREKDRYLACTTLIKRQRDNDSKIIEDTLKQEEFLKKGIMQLMNLDMTIQCLNGISDNLTEFLYKDGRPLGSVFDINPKEYEYIKVDYDKYGKMNEFFFDDEHRDVLRNINMVISEQIKKAKKISKEKKDKKDEDGNKGDL